MYFKVTGLVGGCPCALSLDILRVTIQSAEDLRKMKLKLVSESKNIAHDILAMNFLLFIHNFKIVIVRN